MNEHHLIEARDRALKHFGDAYPITVLDPEITAYDYPPSGQRRIFKCEALPPISCAAIFDSVPTSRDDGCNSSALIVWFQSDWGLPSGDIQRKIGELDWDEIARDWMW